PRLPGSASPRAHRGALRSIPAVPLRAPRRSGPGPGLPEPSIHPTQEASEMADLAVTANVDHDGPAANGQRSVPMATLVERESALVPLASIRVHPLNLRKELRGVDELADSIRQNGLLEPVLLVPDPEPPDDGAERFLLVAGHRRHAACVAA